MTERHSRKGNISILQRLTLLAAIGIALAIVLNYIR